MNNPDYEDLARNGMPAGELARLFLQVHHAESAPEYPLNPFDMIRKTGATFTLRPFDKLEGVYIPADDSSAAVIGVNLDRPITRQRFSAAHELCHHLKDANSSFACVAIPESPIERYAENFAAELLMPREEMTAQIEKHGSSGKVSFDGALEIAEHFGTSFQACLFRLAYDFHAIDGDTCAESLKARSAAFRPMARRKENGYRDVRLYEQVVDASEGSMPLSMDARTKQRFETEYVYHDSRMEGVNVSREKASEIIVDLRVNGPGSVYCSEHNGNMIEVAGLAKAYDFVFDKAMQEPDDITIYDTKRINEILFSATPFPEFGGRYRESNTLVLGGKFETVDHRSIPQELMILDKSVRELMEEGRQLPRSEYIRQVIRIHHRLTVVHPFRDGNGRTIRAFTNLLFLRREIPPVLFREDSKEEYKDSLLAADTTGGFLPLNELYMKGILQSYSELTSI